MAERWLSIIGIGDDGLAGLSQAAKDAIANADSIFGGARHLKSLEGDKRLKPWPLPFSVEPVLAERGKKVVVLASGDPFWHGVGGSLSKHLKPEEWAVFPAPSTFSLAAARLGWQLEETICLGLHATPFTRLRRVLSDGVKAICLVRDGNAVGELAAWLADNNFDQSTLTILEALGGDNEHIRSQTASIYALDDVNHPVAVAIQAKGSGGLSRASGLPDDLFEHDGQITKQPVRALTLSALAPRPGERLWDIGAGSGSISIEWLLAAPASTAIAIEANSDRAQRIANNAAQFGVEHRLEVKHGSALDVVDTLEAPDAVMIGGGASEELLQKLIPLLPAGCRLVANAVTLESEAMFSQWAAQKGGRLMRIELSQTKPLGSKRGWQSAMPVVQWSVTL